VSSHNTFAWPGTSLGPPNPFPYPSGSQYPGSSGPVALRPQLPQQTNGLAAGAFRFDGEPHPRVDPDAALPAYHFPLGSHIPPPMDQIAPGYLAYQAPSSIPSGCPGPHDQLPATTWPCSASLPTPPLLSTSNPAVQNLTCHGDECFSSLVGLPSRGNGQLEGRGSCYPPIQEASVNAVAPASDQIEDYFATDVAVLNEHYMPGEVQHSVQDDSRVAVSLEVSVAVEPKPADEPHSELMKSRKKRARFDEGLRTETSNTRIMGACLRCRNQRIRVSTLLSSVRRGPLLN
jgi:hypothetical protein